MKKILSMLLILILCIGTTTVFADVAEDITVTSADKVLVKDVDYTLTYRDNTNPGTATVIVNFIGNYAGTMEQTFEIKKAKRQSTGGGRGSGGNRIIITPTAKYDSPYITGYADGTFRPESAITRAEATTTIARAIGLEPQSSGNAAFDDVAKHWAESDINAAADNGIVNGYADGSFRPDESITRAEFAKIIAKMLGGASQNDKAEFIDTAGHWAEAYIAVLAEKGVITGYEDNTFRPDEAITRAEAVAIINRAVTRNYAPNLIIPFKDVTDKHWAYADIVKAAGRTGVE